MFGRIIVCWILRFSPGNLMPLMWNSSVSFPSWSEMLPTSIYLKTKKKQKTGSLNLPKTLLEAVEDVKAADLLCSCLAALTSQRPKHSAGYKQKEFLRAAKVVIRWLLYYSGIRSDERKRKGRPETPSHRPFQGWYPTSRQLNIKTWWVRVRLQHWASAFSQLWFYP